jgi:hypothetical protein
LVIAKAYVDQLARSQALPADRIDALQKAIHSAEGSHMNESKRAKKLKAMAAYAEQSSTTAKTPADAKRLHALAEILKHPTA